MPLDDLGEAFGFLMSALPTYKDGVLRRFTYADNGKGTMSKTPVEAPVRVQIDNVSQSQLPEGYAEDDVKMIVLAFGLDQYLDEPRLKDDDEIEIPEANATYRVAAPLRDAVNSHWTCRGRLKPNQPTP